MLGSGGGFTSGLHAWEHPFQDGGFLSVLTGSITCAVVRHFWSQASLSSRTSECSFAYFCPKYLAQGLSVKEGRPPVSDMSQPVLVELWEREACNAQNFGLLGEAKP